VFYRYHEFIYQYCNSSRCENVLHQNITRYSKTKTVSFFLPVIVAHWFGSVSFIVCFFKWNLKYEIESWNSSFLVNKKLNSCRHKETIQSSFDLLGEMVKFNYDACKQMDTILNTESKLKKAMMMVNNNLIDSNMFIRYSENIVENTKNGCHLCNISEVPGYCIVNVPGTGISSNISSPDHRVRYRQIIVRKKFRKVWLKGQYHDILSLGFFHQSITPRALILGLKPVRIWLRILRETQFENFQNRIPGSHRVRGIRLLCQSSALIFIFSSMWCYLIICFCYGFPLKGIRAKDLLREESHGVIRFPLSLWDRGI
jgi:hypothetical protein